MATTGAAIIHNSSRLAILTAGMAILTVALPAGALAHARYDHSTPSPGQVMATSPPAVDIYTAQDMRKTAGSNELTVSGPNQDRVDTGNTVVDDSNRKHLSVGLKPNLPPGRYSVAFKTLSDEDGEVDHGQFVFYVGAPPSADQKAIDARLALTSAIEDQQPPSRKGFYLAIAVLAAVVVLGAASVIARTRRRRPAG